MDFFFQIVFKYLRKLNIRVVTCIVDIIEDDWKTSKLSPRSKRDIRRAQASSPTDRSSSNISRPLRVQGEGQPWLEDNWKPEGAFYNAIDWVHAGLSMVVFGLVLIIVCAIGYLLARRFCEEGFVDWVEVAAGAFSGCGLLFVVLGGFQWRSAVKSGSLELRFTRFPYFLGEPLEVRLCRPATSSQVRRLTATLVCRDDQTAAEFAWQETLDLPVPPSVPWEIPIRFALPANASLFTVRSGEDGIRGPCEWSLEVLGEVPGCKLKVEFPVPVYAKPGNTLPVS
ncbi:MAG TPA: hypothetical protein HPP76_12720 [Desulfuromonadales bacterium]|nr:hypothetical protein [Desulfuromonadales bacterium]